MASGRTAAAALVRGFSLSNYAVRQRATPSRAAFRPLTFPSALPRTTTAGVRWYSSPLKSPGASYGFEDIKAISSNPSPNRILIDVREPAEFQAGAIPTAINIPIVSVPEAFSLPEEEFEDRFGFTKPERGSEVVFYCKSGVRSSAATQLALQNGYENVSEYPGSWLDWEKKNAQEGT